MMNPLSSRSGYSSRLGSNFNPGPQSTGGMPATAGPQNMALSASTGMPPSYLGPPAQAGGGYTGQNYHQGMLPRPTPTIGTPPGNSSQGMQMGAPAGYDNMPGAQPPGPPPGMVYNQAGGGNANYMGPPAQMGRGRPNTFYGSQQTGGQYQPPQQPQQPQQGFQTPRQWSPPTGANFRTMGPRAL